MALDMSAIEEVWRQIQDPSSSTSWLVGTNDNEKPTRSVLVGQGSGGLAGVRASLAEDRAMFGIIRVWAESVTRRAKFVYFLWVGPRTPVSQKMKLGSLKGQWQGFFTGVHTTFEFMGDAGEIDEDTISKRLNSICGAHKPDRYIFGSGGEDATPVDPAASPVAEAEVAAAAGGGGGGGGGGSATGEASPEAPSSPTARASPTTAVTVSGEFKHSSKMAGRRTRDATLRGYDFSELTSNFVLETLQDADEPTAWVVFSLDEVDTKKVRIHASGSGGVEDILPALRDDAIQYGAFRVTAADRSGPVTSIRTKLVYFQWVGDSVKRQLTFLHNEARKTIDEFFGQAHLILRLHGAGDRDVLDPHAIGEQLRRNAGAHQGNAEYRFGYYDAARQAEDARIHAARRVTPNAVTSDSVAAHAAHAAATTHATAHAHATSAAHHAADAEEAERAAEAAAEAAAAEATAATAARAKAEADAAAAQEAARAHEAAEAAAAAAAAAAAESAAAEAAAAAAAAAEAAAAEAAAAEAAAQQAAADAAAASAAEAAEAAAAAAAAEAAAEVAAADATAAEASAAEAAAEESAAADAAGEAAAAADEAAATEEA